MEEIRLNFLWLWLCSSNNGGLIYLQWINDFPRSEDWDPSGTNPSLHVLEHQELHLVLGLHQGGDEDVPGLLRSPLQEVPGHLPGERWGSLQVDISSSQEAWGRGVLVAGGVDEADTEEQLEQNKISELTYHEYVSPQLKLGLQTLL